MKRWIQVMKLVSLLSIIGLGGCFTDDAGESQTQPELVTPDSHNRIYQQGCDLISPYMQLHGVDAPSPNTEKARDEITRGIEELRRVVKFNPENSSAYWVMGKGYQALGESEKACDAFGKSFAIQKDNPDIAREYMFECLNLGRASAAIDAAEHGVSLDPDDAGLIANLAIAYLVGGRIEDAIATADKSLELAPDDEITQHVKTIIVEVRDGQRPQPKSTRELD